MINIKTVKSYCNGDITQIENYERATNDNTQTWDCHHRKETDECLSRKQLDELDLYYNRPASELIFLTHDEHISLHHKGKKTWMCGKHHSEETKRKQSELMKGKNKGKKSEETRQRMSEAHKDKLSAIRGKHRVYDNKELKIYHYE